MYEEKVPFGLPFKKNQTGTATFFVVVTSTSTFYKTMVNDPMLVLSTVDKTKFVDGLGEKYY